MSKTATFLRALLALGVATGGAWYLSVYSCSYPTEGGPGLPPGFVPLRPADPTVLGGRVRVRPPNFAVGSLEHAHAQYLEALPEDVPRHLRFALSSPAQLELEIAAQRAAQPREEPERGAGQPPLLVTSPAGRVARELLFFAWEGMAGFDTHVEVGEGEAEAPVARFRVTSAGGWYPSDAPVLEEGREYRFRVAWIDGRSQPRAFRIATAEEARHYERARRAIDGIPDPRYRAILEVLLARADERTGTALELARRARTLYVEDELVAPLVLAIEAELGRENRAR
ncbi:MAG: hypothetical protein JNM84_18980 [Planctomycetes bacterium]|nr:hypothetical protein [Planctomycetota bacterium]